MQSSTFTLKASKLSIRSLQMRLTIGQVFAMKSKQNLGMISFPITTLVINDLLKGTASVL